MEQYIKKSDIVAEIERRYKTNLIGAHSAFKNGKIEGLREVKDFLNTLEVKEVDLDKEFDNYAKDILACDVQFEPFTHLYKCAKYFYELGLKTQKGE